jgi:hypothetical protein
MNSKTAVLILSSLISCSAIAEYANTLLWGDTHLHTDNSGDAVVFGGAVDVEGAYRFARGEIVTAKNGQPAQLNRPLDFLVIADHAEAYGMFNNLEHPLLKDDQDILAIRAKSSESPRAAMRVMSQLIAQMGAGSGPAILRSPEVVKTLTADAWQKNTELADKFNQPGVFSALIGFEWSSHPAGDNLHRVVVYKDDALKASQMLPFSSYLGNQPEDLWRWMTRYQQKTGGQLLAIPHNSNLSGGFMFPLNTIDSPLSQNYLEQRKRWEPVVEITQIKGDSESHPVLSNTDEFASFGKTGWDIGNLTLENNEQSSMRSGEYIREALKQGLVIEKQTTLNPYQFGVIGSTDSHTGLSTSEEDNFWGKHGAVLPGAERAKLTTKRSPTNDQPDLKRIGWQYQAGGFAAVWARENSREAIFEAMQKREVYGTTGTRIKLRVFGGYDYQDNILQQANWLDLAYKKGVPMGGELTAHAQGVAPKLLIFAVKDPEGANLDRVQVIKGWVDSNGEAQERIYNVAWSDAERRLVDSEGNIPAVGNTVDMAHATYTNAIGAESLSVVWQDPNFDASQNAFYYIRVLEIPSPRWPLYDRVRFSAELPEGTELIQQERAYSSAIWYRSQ